MTFELRTIQDCPNSESALALFQQALPLEGIETDIGCLDVLDDGQAVTLGFHGSPSFMADGVDLFPSDGAPGVSCRVYQAGATLSGLPGLAELRAALQIWQGNVR